MVYFEAQLLQRLCMVDIATLLFLVKHRVIRVCWHYICIFIFSIEGWDWPCSEDTYWDIALSLTMNFDLSWSIVTSDGLYWGVATSFALIEHGDSDSYGSCWDIFIFNSGNWDWLIDLLTYTKHGLSAIVGLDTLLYTGA